MVLLTSGLDKDARISSSRQTDYIVGAGIDTDTAAGTEFSLDIKVNGLAVPDRVNFLLAGRFHGM
jgi:hypothetical protein